MLLLSLATQVPVCQTLIKHSFKVTGVDISSSQIRMAREMVPSATFIESDVMTLNFEVGRFTAIFAFFSVFHLHRDEHLLLFQRIAQV